ncbi:antitoxin MazE family protein, partial [Ectothiorhodospira haloalkaliphila]|uniref:antitoxin MazE family protein n=1 Tax=Ectothiorhodospira haloalkaliphila TaxID=421628 RepID=UPI0030846E74
MGHHQLLHVTNPHATQVACNTFRTEARHMATTHVNTRVKRHRDALRKAGLRPVQIWVPDTRRPDFAEECRRQCL